MVDALRIEGFMVRCAAGGALVALLTGCGVSSPPASSGGVGSLGDGSTADASVSAARGGEAGAAKACDRGLAVVTSDHKSTNLAIVGLDGTPRSGSFVSSGATLPGLSMALSGDVDLPSVTPASKRVVILDRYGANVITWMDLTSAAVLAQLPVGTGFESNPQDYLEVDDTRAFVSRFGTNLAPGVQPFDQGGDLLIIDTIQPAIVGSIPMPEDNPALLPRPGAMSWVGRDVVVSLGRWSPDFAQLGDGRLVGVSPATDSVLWTVDIPGVSNCAKLVLSPSGKLGALACTSKQDLATNAFQLAASDIVIFDTTVSPPRERRRLGVASKLRAAIQPAMAFATEDAIVAKTYGTYDAAGDTAFVVSAATGEVTPLAAAGKPYVLGGVYCSPGCGDVCLLSDAERGRLRRWSVDASGVFTALEDVQVDTIVGMPPRSLGSL